MKHVEMSLVPQLSYVDRFRVPWERSQLGRFRSRRDACAPRRWRVSPHVGFRACQLSAVEALGSSTAPAR